MSDAKVTNRLEMRWFPVVDARGRTRMEARWVDVAAQPALHVTAAHAA